MSTLPTIKSAEAYLNVQLTRSGPTGSPPHVGPFVTISRESGTGGAMFAQALADRLGREGDGQPWAVYGSNLIDEMLRTQHLSPQLARYLPEDRVSEFDASVGEIVGLHPNLWDLTVKTNELMRQFARAGHAILLGRGANFATAEIPHGVHVRLVARAAYRAIQTARRQSLPPGDAVVQNLRRDAARRRYVVATFGADIANAAAYTVVLNIEPLSFDSMAGFIAVLVSGHRQATAAVAPPD